MPDPSSAIIPAQHIANITPSDDDDITASRAVRADVGGDMKVTTAGDETLVIKFADGEERAISVTRIWSDSTTATGIEAMW